MTDPTAALAIVAIVQAGALAAVAIVTTLDRHADRRLARDLAHRHAARLATADLDDPHPAT